MKTWTLILTLTQVTCQKAGDSSEVSAAPGGYRLQTEAALVLHVGAEEELEVYNTFSFANDKDKTFGRHTAEV